MLKDVQDIIREAPQHLKNFYYLKYCRNGPTCQEIQNILKISRAVVNQLDEQLKSYVKEKLAEKGYLGDPSQRE